MIKKSGYSNKTRTKRGKTLRYSINYFKVFGIKKRVRKK